ncbi:GNAT family N-acetyltransferase [Corynebacterium gerontici]|uniref:Acetyltransferase (GNAT) family protein n=1 Tax=Corynebacterium gerontici TaxID=2079234 RepID=A0A3G6J0X5_9CORY|nr:GNAT family N-acetyltransferase [Corynebacterium gerontici]AZA11609.1 Acetyltransferase (GNAT) family protein [Corynebacterium gerontici]
MPTFQEIQAPGSHAEPSEALRAFVFSANLEMQDITGDTATSTSYQACEEMLIGSPESSTTLLCLEDDQRYPLGYLQITESLKDNLDTLDVDFLLHAELQPLAEDAPEAEVRETALTLIDEAIRQGDRRAKRFLNTWLPVTNHRYFQWLRSVLEACGFEPKLEEAHGWIRVPDVPADPVLDAGLNLHVWRDFRIDDAWRGQVAKMLELGDADVPNGALHTTPAPWTLERIESLQKLTVRRGNRIVHTAISNNDRLLGYTAVVWYPTGDPSVAWQDLSVITPEARGRGLGKLLKQHSYAAVREHLPTVQRVCSQVATSNIAMLRLNQALGFEGQTTWVALQKTIGV